MVLGIIAVSQGRCECAGPCFATVSWDHATCSPAAAGKYTGMIRTPDPEE